MIFSSRDVVAASEAAGHGYSRGVAERRPVAATSSASLALADDAFFEFVKTFHSTDEDLLRHCQRIGNLTKIDCFTDIWV